MSGPLPEKSRRRTNAPTIPTTELPASGRRGAAPRVPAWVSLGECGRAWWSWAWHTPQACGWGPGHHPAIARRAALEDDLAAVDAVDSLDFVDVLEAEKATEIRTVVGRLAGLVSGKLGIYREMRELDDRLGLTPKGMAALRWTTIADVAEPVAASTSVPSLDDRRARLTNAS